MALAPSKNHLLHTNADLQSVAELAHSCARSQCSHGREVGSRRAKPAHHRQSSLDNEYFDLGLDVPGNVHLLDPDLGRSGTFK